MPLFKRVNAALIFLAAQMGKNEPFENNEDQCKGQEALDGDKLLTARLYDFYNKAIFADLAHDLFVGVVLLLNRIQSLYEAIFVNVCQNRIPVHLSCTFVNLASRFAGKLLRKNLFLAHSQRSPFTNVTSLRQLETAFFIDRLHFFGLIYQQA